MDSKKKFLNLLQLMRFGVVGGCSTLVHFSLVVLLVELRLMQPLVANVAAFLVSFQVSYWGHRRWTFSHCQALHRVTFPRLFLVSMATFITNEILFFILLSLGMPYPIALFLVLGSIAVLTFTVSKLWVFR